MLIKYFERPRQLVLGQLGGVGACRQVSGGHVIHLANTCTSCASSPPSGKTAVSPSIALAAPGRFSCPSISNLSLNSRGAYCCFFFFLMHSIRKKIIQVVNESGKYSFCVVAPCVDGEFLNQLLCSHCNDASFF